MAPEETTEGGEEVIIFYTLEPEPAPYTCHFCAKEFKTAAKKKFHISKYHVLLR
jgi:hypothetical protein